MSAGFQRVTVRNYRALADVALDLRPINVLFGPNAAGKSTLLDTLWFVRDCAIRGFDTASSARSHGIGLLWDGATEDGHLSVALESDQARFTIDCAFAAGRIQPSPAESLVTSDGTILLRRDAGSDSARFRHQPAGELGSVTLPEPDKLSLSVYVALVKNVEAATQLDRSLRRLHFHHCRLFDFYRLKRFGSEAGHETWLFPRGENLFSVLRNLQGRQAADARYATILRFMRDGFPDVRDLVLDATGPNSVYGSFVERGRRNPVHASGAADGYLQLLLVLTALFAEPPGRESIVLLDEPETSLHPWALAVLARAVKLAAADDWGRQVFIATHSPVLMSQFEAEYVVEVTQHDGASRVRRLSEIADVQDLLERYDVGSLYMAQEVGAQHHEGDLSRSRHDD
jgi:predicted ATPase